ncbi:MAG: ABC transporter ATP-binding protein/permease [Candidatus Roseilinea sp.]|nr:ABC transporter ATP-binding protein/permease [Candidatus Roseilinea sp.]
MFMGLAAEKYDRQYSDRQLLRRMAAYFAPYRGRLIRLALVVLAITTIGLVSPLLIARGIDLVGVQPNVGAIIALCIGLLVLSVVNWLCNLTRRRMTARLIADVIGQMRNDAFKATIHHDMAFFDEFQSGKVITRITNDTQELSQVTVLISDLISQFTILIVLVIVLFTISWQLTLALLVMAPVVVFLGWAFRRVARLVTRSGFRAIAEVNSAIQEAVAGIRVAKTFRQEQAIYDRFKQINRRSYEVNLRRGFVLSNVFPTLNAMAGLGTAVMTYVGGLAAVGGAVSVGAWYLFIISLEQFWFPMTNIASFWSQIQGGLSACERIFALIDAESSVKQIENSKLKVERGDSHDRTFNAQFSMLNSRLRGEIEFKRVDFRYNEQQQVLRDFSLHIAPGESVALVGHTGAGKSSIIKLITRFYEFQGGQILIDGRDIRTFDLTEYRRQLGLVSQTPFLFNDTVMNNIRYARPDLSDAAVEAVARRIGGGEWVEALPNGLHTQVGERGQHLSMGQRQLVALARVLAQHPPIFILDEATASVDPFTEKQIQAALNLILADSTSILIAHRLSTVKSVDRIIVLDHGKIIEEGDHATLMARGGHYAMLYDTYFRHQSADFNAEVYQKLKA